MAVPAWRRAGLCGLVLLLVACGGARPAPVISDLATSVRYPESEYRSVVHGDTLFSIAWETGRDYRELAAWNDIRAPYIIKPGQRLHLFPPKSQPAPARKITASRPATSQSKQRPAATAREKPETAVQPVYGWVWPAEGKITGNFSVNSLYKGLDIVGQRGRRVQAAASGRVVYQGSGLRGYGQLIIIKHNDEFLSAYAHNDKIYVKEGEAVKRGQHIADMGSSGTDHVKLHFEIRRHGTPVNPLNYLPKK